VDYHRTDGHFVLGKGLLGLLQCQPHEVFVHLVVFWR
jgi:hypothetical protein